VNHIKQKNAKILKIVRLYNKLWLAILVSKVGNPRDLKGISQH